MKKHIVVLYVLVVLGHLVPVARAFGPDIDRACRALERIAAVLERAFPASR